MKFAKDLDTSLSTLSALLGSNNESVLNDNINVQIRNVFQIVKSTLQQEAHQSNLKNKIWIKNFLGEKFVKDVQKLNNEDVNLKANDAAETAKNLVIGHEKRLAEITTKWETQGTSQNEQINDTKVRVF